MNKSPLLILGMHRSGTSCLAGCLEAGGLALGEVNTAAGFNKKGNREHEGIRSIHDALLAHHGFSWDRPPPGQVAWRATDLEDLDRETRALRGEASWGMKDPRTVFCMEGWRTLYKPRLVVTYRHPEAVAASLMKRSMAWKQPMTHQTAINLWHAYNGEILRLVSGSDVQCIRYDIAVETYKASVADIAGRLGLDARAAVSFFSPGLINNDWAGHPVPETCMPIWDRLTALSAINTSSTVT